MLDVPGLGFILGVFQNGAHVELEEPHICTNEAFQRSWDPLGDSKRGAQIPQKHSSSESAKGNPTSWMQSFPSFSLVCKLIPCLGKGAKGRQ